MVSQLNKEIIKPSRVVILGGSGFLGGAIYKRLKKSGFNVVAISSSEIDLTSNDALSKSRDFIKNSDLLISASAIAPCKNVIDFEKNIVMAKNIRLIVENLCPDHFINISSDAVYSDCLELINESSLRSPDSMHGLMHFSRELILKCDGVPSLDVRPTLVYGLDDPHNGYGPNRFFRLAKQNKDINLFGNGEERRDHIFVGDVARIIESAILWKSVGAINAVSGKVWSFREVASIIVELSGSKSKIVSNPREGPMPHGGYRAFDNAELLKMQSFSEVMDFPQGCYEAFIAAKDQTC